MQETQGRQFQNSFEYISKVTQGEIMHLYGDSFWSF